MVNTTTRIMLMLEIHPTVGRMRPAAPGRRARTRRPTASGMSISTTSDRAIFIGLTVIPSRKNAEPGAGSLNRRSFKWVMMGNEAKAAEADKLQAQLMRQCLGDDRRKNAKKLAKHARMLNNSVTTHESRTISHHRGSMRQLEREIWAIKRRMDALNTRFPTSGSTDELS